VLLRASPGFAMAGDDWRTTEHLRRAAITGDGHAPLTLYCRHLGCSTRAAP